MEKHGRRYPVLVAMKVSREMDAEIRRCAREDERPVSAFLRRTIAKALQQRDTDDAATTAGR
jgi:hypothetical protein